MPAADREDKTSVISVAIEFLETDASLPTFLAFSEEQRVSDTDTTELLRVMCRSWFGGRLLRELKCYLECLVNHQVSFVSVADKMRLSKTAVSNWYRKAHTRRGCEPRVVATTLRRGPWSCCHTQQTRT